MKSSRKVGMRDNLKPIIIVIKFSHVVPDRQWI